MNGISYQSYTISKHTLGKVSRRNFGRNKGSASTALYNMLYRKSAQKGMIIPKEIKHKDNNTEQYIENYKKNDHPQLNAKQTLGDLFPQEFEILKKKYREEIFTLVNNFLDYKNFIHNNKRTKIMVEYLIQNKDFVKQMISYSLANEMKEGGKIFGKLNQTSTHSIRLNQLYNKLTISNKVIYDSTKLFSLKSLQSYKIYHYIDNLIFTEFLCQTLGIAGNNELLINNKLYHIYTASVQDDIYNGVDIILKDNKENIIGVDLTLYKQKQSGINEISNDKFNTILIANYTPIREQFQQFYKHITEYIYGHSSQPMLDITYTIEEKEFIENRLSSILQYQNNTPSSSDQDIDNSVVMDLGETDHTQHNETV